MVCYMVSHGEVEDAVLLVSLHEIVDKVCIEQGLDDAGDERGPHHVLPLEDPNSHHNYQWKI
jgi:hypothetical protein